HPADHVVADGDEVVALEGRDDQLAQHEAGSGAGPGDDHCGVGAVVADGLDDDGALPDPGGRLGGDLGHGHAATSRVTPSVLASWNVACRPPCPASTRLTLAWSRPDS